MPTVFTAWQQLGGKCERFETDCHALLCPYNASMKKITWNPEKAIALANDNSRGHVSFEECVVSIEGGGLLAIIDNPSPKFQHQQITWLKLTTTHIAYRLLRVLKRFLLRPFFRAANTPRFF
jgi:hypothetical protein